MAASQSAITSTVPTTSSIQKRSVINEDTIRALWARRAKLQALIASGSGKDGIPTKGGKGLITKKSSPDSRYETFTWTPPAISFTVSSVTAGTRTVVVDDSTTIRLTQLLYDVNTDKTIRVGTNTTGTGTLTVTLVGESSTTISATDVVAGDTLIALSPVYPENSTSPYILSKTDDNHFNYMFIGRYPVEISRSAKQQKTYGGDYWSRIKANNMGHSLRLIDHTLLFSQRAYSGATTLDADLADNVRTTRGLMQLGDSSLDCGGTMTNSFFRKNVSNSIDSSVEAGKTLPMFVSNLLYSEMQEWPSDADVQITPGEHPVWGINTKKFRIANYTIEPVVHEAFNQGDLQRKAVIFDPEQLFYCHLTGGDLHPESGRGNGNIAPNDQDGEKVSMLVEAGLGTYDGGASILELTNCVSL